MGSSHARRCVRVAPRLVFIEVVQKKKDKVARGGGAFALAREKTRKQKNKKKQPLSPGALQRTGAVRLIIIASGVSPPLGDL